MPLDLDDLQKLQAMLDRSMPRIEYERLHLELVQRVTKLEQNQAEMGRWLRTEFERIRTERQLLFDRSMEAAKEAAREAMTAVKEVSKQCETIQEALNTSRQLAAEKEAASKETTLRYIIGVIVSFFVGGGLIGLVEFLLTANKS
jgi:CRISPR/Cas system-associated exonuclease Cas4 (RecB family)